MSVDSLVKEILTVVRTLSETELSNLSGDTLSRLAVKLASYKASLGEHVAEARNRVWEAEASYDLVRAESYSQLRDDGKGSTDASELKRIDAHDAFVALNEAKYNYERISTLHSDCHDLIDGIKSRLIHLQSERRESSVY